MRGSATRPFTRERKLGLHMPSEHSGFWSWLASGFTNVKFFVSSVLHLWKVDKLVVKYVRINKSIFLYF